MENNIALFGTFWSLVPPVIAICLALATKEVYSSLLIGIIVGCLLITGTTNSTFFDTLFAQGFTSQITDSDHVNILIFFVILGTISILIQKSGSLYTFGTWAQKKIHSKKGALLTTFSIGFTACIDDYFSCMTVGNIMRPITDKFKISREKLAYIIDSTAAPICIIAPISSWSMAVVGLFHNENGFLLFIQTIFFNFYALFTLIMIVALTLLDFDFGPMKKFEQNVKQIEIQEQKISNSSNSSIYDLIFPILTLVICCVFSLAYSGGFFIDEHKSFLQGIQNARSSFGLLIGSFCSLFCIIVFYRFRKILTLPKSLENLPEGFKAIVPAMIILILAWTLKGVTDTLGAKQFVSQVILKVPEMWISLLPAVIFIVASFLAFSTGTSWGTFGILIPIIIGIFESLNSDLMVLSISACLSGAVCGDHCSPISDTTIMSSTGAECKHINHVSTQLPYAIFVATISLLTFVFAGYVKNSPLSLAFGTALLFAGLLVLKKRYTSHH